MGRKILADSVDYRDDEDNRLKNSNPSSDLTAGDQEIQEKGRAIDENLARGAPRSRSAGREKLSSTEMERRIGRYRNFLEKLNPNEKHAIQEYYRQLRDLK